MKERQVHLRNNSISSALFGQIHLIISSLHQILRRVLFTAAGNGVHPDAAGDAYICALAVKRLPGKRKPQPFRYFMRCISVYGGKADDELIPAVAGDPAVLASDVCAQQPGNGAQHLIARRMAAQVIDFFEAVKADRIQTLYLFEGTEEYIKGQALSRVTNQLADLEQRLQAMERCVTSREYQRRHDWKRTE